MRLSTVGNAVLDGNGLAVSVGGGVTVKVSVAVTETISVAVRERGVSGPGRNAVFVGISVGTTVGGIGVEVSVQANEIIRPRIQIAGFCLIQASGLLSG